MCVTKLEAIRESYRKACSGGTTSTDLWTETRFNNCHGLLSRQLDARIRLKKVKIYRLYYIIQWRLCYEAMKTGAFTWKKEKLTFSVLGRSRMYANLHTKGELLSMNLTPVIKHFRCSFSYSVFIKVYGVTLLLGKVCTCMCSKVEPPKSNLAEFSVSSSSRLNRFCCKLDGLCHVYFAFRCKSIWMKI